MASKGVLYPCIWNFVVDDFIRTLNEQGFSTVGHVDHVVIILNGASENLISILMRLTNATVKRWCIKYKLPVNPIKTEGIFFTNKRKSEITIHYLNFLTLNCKCHKTSNI